jgi:nucleotide-binding universal stress UspA family protein
MGFEKSRKHLCHFFFRTTDSVRALDVPTQIHLEHASAPAAGILAAARKDNQDLVVIGSHGPHGRRLFGLNDVTLEVLSRADRPVLVVPPEVAL